MSGAGAYRSSAADLRLQLGIPVDRPCGYDDLVGAFGSRGFAIEELRQDDSLLAGSFGVLDRDSATVWIRTDLAAPHRNFVLAHELGHLVLHGDRRERDLRLVIADDGGGLIGYSPAERREREANRFAADFLVPGPLARSRVASTGSVQLAAQSLGVDRSTLLASLQSAPARDAANVVRIEDLDPSQRRAATLETAGARIVAGPGTGKTATLSARLDWLISSNRATAERILVLTFSRAASDEVDRRLGGLHGSDGVPVVSTFHAYALDVVRRYAQGGEGRTPWVATKSDVRRSALREFDCLGLDRLSPVTAPGRGLDAALDLDPRIAECPPDWDSSDWHEIESFRRWLENWKISLGALLIDDLIPEAVGILSDEAHRAAEASRWDAVLVDEIQDLDSGQWELLEAVSQSSRAGVWMVGDPNQCIFGFRGARFDAKATEDQVAADRLEWNYRSRPEIVDLANRWVGTSVGWRSARSGTATVRHAFADSDEAQADGIAALVRSADSSVRVAVLCRTRSQAVRIADSLRARGISLGCEVDDLDFLDCSAVRSSAEAAEGLVVSGMWPDEALSELAWERGAPAIAWSDQERAAWGRLHDLARAYRFSVERCDADPRPSFLDFMNYVRDRIHQGEVGGKRPERMDRVLVSTIHRSKGREFDCVVVPNVIASRFPPPTSTQAQHDARDREEEERLFFVALTRARDACWVVSPVGKHGKSRLPDWMDRLDGLVERLQWTEDASNQMLHGRTAARRLAVGSSFVRTWEICPARAIFDRISRTERELPSVLHSVVRRRLAGIRPNSDPWESTEVPAGLRRWCERRLGGVPASTIPLSATSNILPLPLPTGVILWKADLQSPEGAYLRLRLGKVPKDGKPDAHWMDHLASDAWDAGVAHLHAFDGQALCVQPTPRILANARTKAESLLAKLHSGRAPMLPSSRETCLTCPHLLRCPRDNTSVRFDPFALDDSDRP